MRPVARCDLSGCAQATWGTTHSTLMTLAIRHNLRHVRDALTSRSLLNMAHMAHEEEVGLPKIEETIEIS